MRSIQASLPRDAFFRTYHFRIYSPVNETDAFAILATIPNLGAIKIRLLLQEFGSALNALNTSQLQIAKLPGFSRIAPCWGQWQHTNDWEQDLALAKQLGAQLIPFTSPLFPKALLEAPDHPALLYVQGQIKPQDQRSIAIVGTRHASIYGNEMAAQISHDLAAQGFTVISGLARGIDTSAHQGALKAGRTLAVIGSGLADIYPEENRPLARAIIEKGALISEFRMTTPPDRQNFPQRNRIVSGMSLAILLIEAPIRSGAMITMEKGYAQKRPLFALPGRADNENFRGNHELIKSGKAKLVENAADIIRHFDSLFPLPALQTMPSRHLHLDPREQTLLQAMAQEELHIDTIAHLSSLPIHQVQTILMSLVMRKIVKEFPGKLYKKVQ